MTIYSLPHTMTPKVKKYYIKRMKKASILSWWIEVNTFTFFSY